MSNLPLLAIILPCYNEEDIIELSAAKISELLNDLISKNKISKDSYISFVDDGSIDSTYNKLSDIAKENKKIKVLKLACNFGHQKAILCGITTNKADIYVTLDCDLQDDIDIVEDMIEKYQNEGVDVVYGVRNNRDSDCILKHLITVLYYLIAKIFGVKQIYNAGDFRLISNKVAEFLRKISDYNLYLRGLIYGAGFKHSAIYFKRKKRIGGNRKYTFSKLYTLATDGLSHSSRPLDFILVLSAICFIISLCKTSCLFLLSGINLLALWILGIYIFKAYFEAKSRPVFAISDKRNYD